MKRSVLLLPAALLAVPHGDAPAQTGNLGPWSWDQPGRSPNRLALAYRMGFNVDVQFRGLGSFDYLPGVNPGPASGAQEHRTYDDGFNRVDSNLNTYGGVLGLQHPGATWYWNHDRNAQVVDVGGTRYVEMHAAQSPTTFRSGKKDADPLHGVELSFERQIQSSARWSWGVAGAFNYTRLEVRDASARTADVEQVRDRFEVPLDAETNERFVPDAQDHMGTLNGPGPLLGSHPLRTVLTLTDEAAIKGRREFEADLFGIRLGPYVQCAFGDKVSGYLGGGLALVCVASDFRFTETATFRGRTYADRAGSGSNSDWLVGGYVAGSMSYRLNEAWQLLAGAQFQSTGTYKHTVKGKQAWMDLEQAFFVTVGVSYSF